MTDLYIIVHADNETMKDNPKIAKEIRRIRREENFLEVQGGSNCVDYKVPKDKKIKVCGFYHGRQEWDSRCVDEHIKALKRKGFSPELYLPATVSLDP